MRDKTIIPTNLLSWPRTAALLPDQRLILLWLWACPYLTAAGCGLIPLRAAAATLGLDPAARDGGRDTLVTAKLIDRDKETGEVFVLDWYRFHTFRPGVPAKAAAASIQKVQSERLKKLILEKSKTCLPTATPTPTLKTTSACIGARERAPMPAPSGADACNACKERFLDIDAVQNPTSPRGSAEVGNPDLGEQQPGVQPGQGEKRRSIEHQVLCWYDSDRQAVKELVKTHGAERVEQAASELVRAGTDPLRTRVQRKLEKGTVHAKFRRQEKPAGFSGDDIAAMVKSTFMHYGRSIPERVVDGERIG